MDARVAKLKSVSECEAFARNARARILPELADQALKRSVELQAEEHHTDSEVELECWKAIYAYEAVLSAKKGHRQPAARTRQMITKYGMIRAVERVVARKTDASGYTALVEMGLTDLAFEAVVLRHSEHFSADAIARSSERLRPKGAE